MQNHTIRWELCKKILIKQNKKIMVVQDENKLLMVCFEINTNGNISCFFSAHLCQLLTGSCHPAPGHITYRLKCSQSPITGRIMRRRAVVGQWRRFLVATLWCRYVINTVLLCLSQHIEIHCTYCNYTHQVNVDLWDTAVIEVITNYYIFIHEDI